MEPPLPQGASLHAFHYGPQEMEEWRPASMAGMRARVTEGKVLWINANGIRDPSLLPTLEKEFGIHPLTLEDIQNFHQRPKVEDYPGYLFIVAQMLKTLPDGELDTEQVSILLGDGWLVTIQEGKPGDVFEGVRERLRLGRPTIRRSASDYLCYAILDSIVDAYFPILESLGLKAEYLEEEILEGAPSDVRGRLQLLRRDLLTLRRVAWPQRDAVASLERGETRWVKPGTKTFLRDVSDHATRVIDFVETNRELMASLMDLYLANVAQKTTDVMKVLTLVATIFIPLTFIAGVYGMNFEHMPELDEPWAYPAILLFMAALGIGMYLAFRRRGWV